MPSTAEAKTRTAGVIKVALVEDNAGFRESLCALINGTPGFRCAGAFATAEEGLKQIPPLAPDVVHSHDVYGLMVKGLRVPRVFTIHGFIHADTLVSGSRLARLRSWIWRFFEVAGWRD